MGTPCAKPYPARARCKFGGSRLGGMRSEADIPVGLGGRGTLAAFALKAEMEALSRKGASEALGGQLDVAHISLMVSKQGGGYPARIKWSWPLRFRRNLLWEGARKVGKGPNLFSFVFRVGFFEEKSDVTQ